MSDDWFDKTYRSEETPPPDLDARILKRARRATRRWAGSLVAAGIFTIAAVLVLAIMLANIELDVPPAERPAAGDVPPYPAAEGDCERSLSLVGPLGGPGRQDRTEICLAGDLLRADISWDGEPACPSHFSVAASPDTHVRLGGGSILIGSARYRCVDGVWTAE